MKKTILLLTLLLALVIEKNQAQTVTDIDGNHYNTVTIGSQIWMQENLKVTHYRNGSLIPNDTSTTLWDSLSTGARCYYNNDSVANAPVYGVLYNWYAVNDIHNICPIGWHVPSDREWTTLITYLGGESVAGGKMKDTGSIYWNNSNIATNESGLSCLPGGIRYYYSSFLFSGLRGFWWSSTVYSTPLVWMQILYYDMTSIETSNFNMKSGLSVLCIKDSVDNPLINVKDNQGTQIYPNPMIDKLYIDCAEMNDLTMKVYNLIGEYVMQRKLNNETNEIDVSSLPEGIFIIQLTGESISMQQKLIKNLQVHKIFN